MYGAFDDQDFEPAPRQPDTVLTLGPTMAIGIALGLALLCGLSFGLGYAVGRRSQPPAQTAAHPSAPEKQAIPASDTARNKPSATGQGASAEKQTRLIASYSDISGQRAPASDAKPAASSGRTADASSQPAASSSALMVQIAAVSHQEDAAVLVDALRRHGYSVAVSRDPEDNLLHVRIGPFHSRDEAAAWRQKLLSDGYNAVLQP